MSTAYDDLIYLQNETPEFCALADAVAVFTGPNGGDTIRLPLHRQILAKGSKVFAQLFSSLAESPASGTNKDKNTSEIDVTSLLSDSESGPPPLKAHILVTLYVLYNPAAISKVLDCHWPFQIPQDDQSPLAVVMQELGLSTIYKELADTENAELERQQGIIQKAVSLLDKLDARELLTKIQEIMKSNIGWVGQDPLGWLMTAERLGLYGLRANAICRVAASIQGEYNPIETKDLLKNPKWAQLEPRTLLMLLDAMATASVDQHGVAIFPEKWQRMGDAFDYACSKYFGGEEPVPQELLDELEAAQEEAAEEWNAGFNGEDGGEDF